MRSFVALILPLEVALFIITTVGFVLRPPGDSTNEAKASGQTVHKTRQTLWSFPCAPSASSGLLSLSAPAIEEFAVFYHIYVPPGNDTDANVIRIVQEQIGQVGLSYVGGCGGMNRNTSTIVYYNTVGRSGLIQDSFMAPLCESYGLRCIHMDHKDQGFEELTLQSLYGFCQGGEVGQEFNSTKRQKPVHDNKDEDNIRVVYIHSKGSYHPGRDQENWRYHMTLAATSEACNKKQAKDDTCNVCGLQFWAYWVPFMPGNMWSATCSYVRKLLPPNSFEQRYRQVTGMALVRTVNSKNSFTSNWLTSREDIYGLNRYAAEHWVGSHPSIVPCDVGGQYSSFDYWIENNRRNVTEDYKWAMAPRTQGEPIKTEVEEKKFQNLLGDKMLRKKEYFMLAGKLFVWQELYNQAPPQSSWAWNFYPDGHAWKQLVQKHGNQTVDLVLSDTIPL